MTSSRKHVGSPLKNIFTDLLQLEHWVYAKSVHAFMWLHMLMYHMQILIAVVKKYAG